MKKILAMLLLCGMIILSVPVTATEESTSHTHVYTWTVDRDASCSQTGIKHEECSCGATRNENTPIATTAHSLSGVNAKNSTCTEAGNKAYWYCTVCGKYFSDANGKNEISQGDTVIAAKGHSYVWKIVKATSSGEQDKEVQTCSSCGATGESRYISGHTHKMTSYAAKQSTCQSEGNIAYWYCSDCKTYFKDAAGNTSITLEQTKTAKSDHRYAWVTDKEASATQTGLKHEECTVCGIKRNENTVIPATGGNTTEASTGTSTETTTEHKHVIKELKAKEASCQTDGNIACWYCAGCNRYYSDAKGTKELKKQDVILSKTGHTFVWVEDTPATAESTGIKHEECTVCGAVQSENTVIPLVGHEHILIKMDAREATCSEEGNTEYYICSECALIFRDADAQEEITMDSVRIDPVAHTPVVDENGNLICEVCGAAIEEEEMTEAPKMVRGANQSWDKSESLGTTFATNIVPSAFRRVLVDGQPLTNSDYKTRGETIEVTLDVTFLRNLTEGQHTLVIETKDGEAVTFFSITDRSGKQGIDPWIFAVGGAVLLLIPLAWVTFKLVKKNRQERKKEQEEEQKASEE